MDDFKLDPIDPKRETSYNNDNSANAPQPTIIDMRRQKPLYDAKCEHDLYQDLQDGDARMFKVFKCRNCPVGYLETL